MLIQNLNQSASVKDLEDLNAVTIVIAARAANENDKTGKYDTSPTAPVLHYLTRRNGHYLLQSID